MANITRQVPALAVVLRKNRGAVDQLERWYRILSQALKKYRRARMTRRDSSNPQKLSVAIESSLKRNPRQPTNLG
jgi:hypothetical protein